MRDQDLDVRVALLERIAEDLSSLTKDHESRLRWIEKIAYYGLGMMGVGSIGTFALSVFDHVSKHG